MSKAKPRLSYGEQIAAATRKAQREGNAEAVRYYTEYVSPTSCACASFEQFKGSWAHEQWVKNRS